MYCRLPISFFYEIASWAGAGAEHVLHVEDVGHLLGCTHSIPSAPIDGCLGFFNILILLEVI